MTPQNEYTQIYYTAVKEINQDVLLFLDGFKLFLIVKEKIINNSMTHIVEQVPPLIKETAGFVGVFTPTNR